MLRGVHVLLADDNEDISDAIAAILKLAGADVIVACDGISAVEHATAARFDVVVMDIQMPTLDGLDATRRIRASGNTVPVIALTADAMSEHRELCLAAGCDAYLSKPVDHVSLVEQIRTLASK